MIAYLITGVAYAGMIYALNKRSLVADLEGEDWFTILFIFCALSLLLILLWPIHLLKEIVC